MVTPELPWQAYEREVHEELASKFRDATVRHDVRLPGLRSGTSRQIDVLVQEVAGTVMFVTIVDAKFHSRPIDVTHVEAFIGLLQDVGITRGMMISPIGYTEAALARAFRDDVDVDLDILSLEELKHRQAHGAIPFAGNTGVIVSAPIGWVIEAGPVGGVLARLYRRGWTYEQAYDAGEFMYINIWSRKGAIHNLELLLETQEKGIRRSFPDALITITRFAEGSRWQTFLRRAEIPQYRSAELTAFIEFPRGVLFVVLFSPLVVQRRNLRKLEYVMRTAILANMTHTKAEV